MNTVEQTLGSVTQLTILDRTDSGILLDGRDMGRIFLQRQGTQDGPLVGESIQVFVYTDSNGVPTATIQTPLATVGECAFLQVVDVSTVGAFLDWGLPKDLFVPFREQKTPMTVGHSYIVKIYLDTRSNRIAASTRLDKWIADTTDNLSAGEKVNLLFSNRTSLGWKAVVNNDVWGMLHSTDVFGTIKSGTQTTGFIKTLRDDGKIDLSLEQPGYGKVTQVCEAILSTLKENRGSIPVTDHSPPHVIREWFGVSKKTYKKALGALYKERRVVLSRDEVSLS